MFVNTWQLQYQYFMNSDNKKLSFHQKDIKTLSIHFQNIVSTIPNFIQETIDSIEVKNDFK